jgi:hypothetical protein
MASDRLAESEGTSAKEAVLRVVDAALAEHEGDFTIYRRKRNRPLDLLIPGTR